MTPEVLVLDMDPSMQQNSQDSQDSKKTTSIVNNNEEDENESSQESQDPLKEASASASAAASIVSNNDENENGNSQSQDDQEEEVELTQPFINNNDNIDNAESHNDKNQDEEDSEKSECIVNDLPEMEIENDNNDNKEQESENEISILNDDGENENSQDSKDSDDSNKTTPITCNDTILSTDDEDDAVGKITIRDFGSLREDPSSDEEIVEIPAPVRMHTPYVLMNEDSGEFTTLDLYCEIEAAEDKKTKKPEQYMREHLISSMLLKRKFLELARNIGKLNPDGIRAMQRGGTVPAPAPQVNTQLTQPAPMPTPSATPTLNISNFMNQARLTLQPNNLNNIRANHTPISIVRSKVSTPTPTTTVMQNSAGNVTFITPQTLTPPVSTSSNMNQLVYDPKTGVLFCPTSTSSVGNQVQQYKAIQASPQILAAINKGSVKVTCPLTSNGATATSTSPTTTGSGRRVSPAVTDVAASMLRAAASAASSNITTTAPAPTRYLATTVRIQGSSATLSPLTPHTTLQQATTSMSMSTSPLTSSRLAPTNTNQNQASPPSQTRLFMSGLQDRTPSPVSISNSPKPPSALPPASASVIRKPYTKPVTVTTKPVENHVPAGTQQTTSAPSGNEKDNAKTFPSLVVLVKPCLKEKLSKSQVSAARADLDLRVKTMLLYSPSKFTEFLMQKGLLKVEQKCSIHSLPLKLGMYSDGNSKQPFSGGYVWISDCCPEKQTSVFLGSIFEASMYTPGIISKLIYHWACQTPASNVLQWVKVTSYYLKNFYTLLRSACVAGLHENFIKMGGRGKYVEIGIITLGTTVASNSGQKSVKIEILGVFDPSCKSIRMKVINPSTTHGLEYSRERINQIITPLTLWVEKTSVLLIDSSMDKNLLKQVGFLNVSQITGSATVPQSKSATPTNVNVMNYLKNIVPKMFQNTLCVLSKSLIQQFLDELSWRETWGNTPSQTFDTLLSQMVQMTKADTGETLIARLNKISLNPFAEWSYSKKAQPGIDCLPDSISGGTSSLSDLVPSMDVPSGINAIVSTYMKNKVTTIKSASSSSASLTNANSTPATTAAKLNIYTGKRKSDDKVGDMQQLYLHGKKTHTVQGYYYVYCPRPSPVPLQQAEFPSNLKCPLCSKSFRSNLEAMTHIASHVLSAGRISNNPFGCRYCLKELPSQTGLDLHVANIHKRQDMTSLCRICNEKFNSDMTLVIHMWQRHVECEAPYRCEVCSYRSSFHYDVVDHFYKEHGGSDVVQCSACLKVMSAKTIGCLKHVVVHLQNHMIKKGKKCQDCLLVFSNDTDYRTHMLADASHESRRDGNFAQHIVIGNPVWMPKPPQIDKAVNLPPPTKKSRGAGKSSGSSVQTLNSAIAVPLNPNDKFMITPAKWKITDTEKLDGMDCWECSKPINSLGHFRGIMKCSRCRYETCCYNTMTTHSKTHNKPTPEKKYPNSQPLNMEETHVCCRCDFTSANPDRFARHMAKTGHRSCAPENSVD